MCECVRMTTNPSSQPASSSSTSSARAVPAMGPVAPSLLQIKRALHQYRACLIRRIEPKLWAALSRERRKWYLERLASVDGIHTLTTFWMESEFAKNERCLLDMDLLFPKGMSRYSLAMVLKAIDLQFPDEPTSEDVCSAVAQLEDEPKLDGITEKHRMRSGRMIKAAIAFGFLAEAKVVSGSHSGTPRHLCATARLHNLMVDFARLHMGTACGDDDDSSRGGNTGTNGNT